MEYLIRVDHQLARDAGECLEEIGLDLSVATTMMLKRIVRDGGISFLVADRPKNDIQSAAVIEEGTPVNTGVERITKSTAINLFKEKGCSFNQNVTYASKNKAGNYYWANPAFEVLKDDWYLILNDWKKRELHLFWIPGRRLKMNVLRSRADNAEKIDLQIAYNDPTFTDSRSKISFAQFCVEHVTY